MLTAATTWLLAEEDTPAWSDGERRLLNSLSLTSLPEPPDDPTNRYADDPRAAALGHRLFFDQRLSANGKVACSTCHDPERFFTDALAMSVGVGLTARNAMTVVGAAYSPFLFWDGRKDSQWSQALAPLESTAEHGSNRMRLTRLVAEDRAYQLSYEALFGPLPDLRDRTRFPTDAAPLGQPGLQEAWERMAVADRELVTTVFVNLGKALAAYQRQLLPGFSRFDHYVAELREHGESATLTPEEQAGLALFIGRGRCVHCHNGPLFSNYSFHNTGILPSPGQLPSKGRSAALGSLKLDPFSCRGAYNDARELGCPELEFMRSGDELMGAHRTPTLRNVAQTGPYMHAGQLATLAEVLDHYNKAPGALVGHNEAKPLGLSQRELDQLEAFLTTLSGPIAAQALSRPTVSAAGHHPR